MKPKTKKNQIGSGVSSMTGFGANALSHQGRQISVEIRSVNNRFCEIGMRIPRELNVIEGDLRDRIRSRVARGKISLLVSLTRDGEQEEPLKFDVTTAQTCFKALQELNQHLGSTDPVALGHLLQYSDYFLQEVTRESDEALKTQVLVCLEAALDSFSAMRHTEGVSLGQDLLARLLHIEEIAADIERLAADQPRLHLEKLHTRLEMLTPPEKIDPGRLETELALFADRLDITEECVRLRSHCQVFRQALAGSEPPGKRLGFILQEMNREVNTMSAKSVLAEISHSSVNIKEELERLREQIQNLE